jgi:PAS domain S-box-containing protein
MTLDLKNIFTSIDNSNLILQAIEEQNYSVVITDAQRKIIYLNDVFEKMTGYGISELMGQKPAMLQGEATTPASVLHLKNSLKSKIAFEGDVINYRKSGETYLCRIAVTPIFKKGECTHYVAFGKDVTTYNNTATPTQQLLYKLNTFIENNVALNITIASIIKHLNISEALLKEIIDTHFHTDLSTFISNSITNAKTKLAKDEAASKLSRQLIAAIFEN